MVEKKNFAGFYHPVLIIILVVVLSILSSVSAANVSSTSITTTSSSAAATTADDSRSSRGLPKIQLAKGSSNAAGSFWLHVAEGGDNGGGGGKRQLTLASITAGGVVRNCSIALKELDYSNISSTTWHFIKWTLRNNDFSCTLFPTNLTSPPTVIPSQSSSSDTVLSITLGPGNGDYCVFNATLGESVALECARVRKVSGSTTTTTTVKPKITSGTCGDCPPLPPNHIVKSSHQLLDEASGHSSTIASNSGNSEFSGDHEPSESTGNSISARFPTPGPFTPGHLTPGHLTPVVSVSMTKTVGSSKKSNITDSTTTPAYSTAAKATSTSTNSCQKDGREDLCKNGGTCIRNSTSYYCNCTSGFYGSLCQYDNKNNNNDTNVTLQHYSSSVFSTPTPESESGSQCPRNYCENGGTCRPTISASSSSSDFNANLNFTMNNFTCFCAEGYLGRRCSYRDLCHAGNPCQNGGYCSVSVPVYGDEQQRNWNRNRNRTNWTATANNNASEGAESTGKNASFRCQCEPGFGGDRCQTVEADEATSTPKATAEECDYRQVAKCEEKAGTKCAEWNNTTCNCTTKTLITGVGSVGASYCELIGSSNDMSSSSGSSTGTNNKIPAIVGGVLGSLAFIGLIIGSVFLYRHIQRSRKLKGKYNPAKEEMTAAGGQTLTMATVPTGERLI